MRLFFLALLLAAPALAQPVDTERGAAHIVVVAPGDALLIRLANLSYGAVSDSAPVAIFRPDGTVMDEDPEWSPGASLRLNEEAVRVVVDAAPGLWAVAFVDEETGAQERLTIELVAAPVLNLSLHEAAGFGDTAALRVAIDAAEFGVDDTNGRYQTPLMLAAGAGSAETVQMLLAAGANPNAMTGTDGAGYEMMMSLERPLHYAAGAGAGEVVELLLAAGADPTLTDAHGVTASPLFSAVYGKSAEVVRALLAAGADPSERDESGKTAAEVATDQADAEWTSEDDRATLLEIIRLLSE